MGAMIYEARQREGLSQEQLAQEVGCSQSTIDRIEKDQGKRPSAYLPAVARRLGIDLAVIDAGLKSASAPRAVRVPALAEGPRDVPVYASVEAGEGAIMVTTEPIDWVERPEPLVRVKRGYALLVMGDSMFPAYRPGDLVLLNPHLPPRREDGVVLYAGEPDGTVKATLKEFVRSTQTEWVLRRYSPQEAEFRLLRSDWPICHVVVAVYKRR